MPLPGIYASSIFKGGPQGAYDALGSVTVPSGGAASVTFAGIPTGYKHLELRIFAQSNRGTYGIDEFYIQFNGDTSASYSQNFMRGDGAAVSAEAYASQTALRCFSGNIGTQVSGAFGANIVNFLDYASSTKNKTMRAIGGVDINGTIAGYGGRIGIASGAWLNTNPITTINIIQGNGTLFSQYSSFALYGVK